MRCAARCVFFPVVERDTQCPRLQPDFDLDTVIEKRLGRDDPETVKLTGRYRNPIGRRAEA
jgi:hypothetical protein